MKKNEFLTKLEKGLSKFSEVEIKKVITYYEEIIMDRLEENEKESDIIASFGSIDSIIKKVSMEIVDKRMDNDNSNKHVIRNFFAIIGLGFISWPLILVFSILFVVGIFVFYVVSISLALGSVVSFIATIVSLIGSNISAAMICLEMFTYIGIVGVCILLAYLIYTYGTKFLKWTTKKLTGFIRKKDKNKEVA